MKLRIGLSSLALAVALGASGCQSDSQKDPELSLYLAESLPAVIAEAPVVVREAYQFAAANPGTLAYIPCYCGCGAPPHSHASVADCFVREVRADGTVVWDDMGLG